VQNYTFLFKHRLFPIHLDVFYEAIPADPLYLFLAKEARKRMPLPSGLKKIRQVAPDGNLHTSIYS